MEAHPRAATLPAARRSRGGLARRPPSPPKRCFCRRPRSRVSRSVARGGGGGGRPAAAARPAAATATTSPSSAYSSVFLGASGKRVGAGEEQSSCRPRSRSFGPPCRVGSRLPMRACRSDVPFTKTECEHSSSVRRRRRRRRSLRFLSSKTRGPPPSRSPGVRGRSSSPRARDFFGTPTFLGGDDDARGCAGAWGRDSGRVAHASATPIARRVPKACRMGGVGEKLQTTRPGGTTFQAVPSCLHLRASPPRRWRSRRGPSSSGPSRRSRSTRAREPGRAVPAVVIAGDDPNSRWSRRRTHSTSGPRTT